MHAEKLNQETTVAVPIGFRVRHATLADAQTVTDLLNAAAVTASGAPKFSLTECLQEWASPGFNLATSSLMVIAADGRLAGYVEVWDDDDLPTTIEVFGATHPDFEGQGIGTYLLTWAEARARQALVRVPSDTRVVMTAFNDASYLPANNLLRGYGMTLARAFLHMSISLDTAVPAPSFPQGITVTTLAEFSDVRAVYRATTESFADHWGHVERAEEAGFKRFAHVMDDPDFDASLWFVALDGDEVAAVCLCMPKSEEDPTKGHVRTLGVRRPWRRQGLGLALLHHAFAEFQRRGRYSHVTLGVDADSLTDATRLYEKAGMTAERRMALYEKELRGGRDLRTQSLDD